MEQENIYKEYDYPENITSTDPYDEYLQSTATAKPSLYPFPHFTPSLEKAPMPTGCPKDDNIISTNENDTYYNFNLTDVSDFPFLGNFCVRHRDTPCDIWYAKASSAYLRPEEFY